MSGPTAYLPQGFDVPIDLDLSKNEGRSRAEELVASIEDPQRLVGRYPDTSALRARLAALHGVGMDRVLVTAGGDDALARCFMARVGSGRQAVTTYPTFEMIARYAEQRRAELVEVPWWTGPLPVPELVETIGEQTDAVFIVSPNNPTGAIAAEVELLKLAGEAPLLVVDAAYVEFAETDPTPALLELPNVVVTRTLSKAYGLAGLRVGYLMGPPELVASIGAHGSPYPVSALSSEIATIRLDRPVEELTSFVEEVRRERVMLTGVLAGLGTRPLPSEGNFVLAEASEAAWLVAAAASLGVGLRRFADRPGLEGAVRITLPGDRDDFTRLVATLGAALAPEAMIFDLDGVIADVSQSQTLAIIETARTFGVEVGPEDIETAKGEGGTSDDWALTRALCRRGGVDPDLNEVTARFETLYQGDGRTPGLKMAETPLVDRETWQRWAARLPLAVVTGRPRTDAVEFLDRFGLAEALAALVTRDEAPLKPDPTPVRVALEAMGVSRAWMLGDTPDDLKAARAAGVVPIGVIAPGDDPEMARHRLQAAARILDKTTDLEGMLR
ncbi:MAG TPA: aminotransferase class I/II-fold pyridoxal phosphate-dependent enzyme [Acidimicrobiia bacterium]|nr:aminotransferase class I/II-fold pyridoxal phosphate-dependent enzyme [Acidimicrobiia bacterium]